MCKHIKDKKKITFFPTTPFALKKSKEYARREDERRETRDERRPLRLSREQRLLAVYAEAEQ